MTPTETLKHEHQVVLLVLKGMEREAQILRAKGKPSFEDIRSIVDFSRNFTDRCHHAKEEKHLFPAMERHGMAHDQGPIAVMLAEHTRGRALNKAISEALPGAEKGDSKALEALRDSLEAYAQLLKGHIAKEDQYLFPTADRLLPPEEQKALEEAFDKVEKEEMGEGTHERYHQLAHKLGEGKK